MDPLAGATLGSTSSTSDPLAGASIGARTSSSPTTDPFEGGASSNGGLLQAPANGPKVDSSKPLPMPQINPQPLDVSNLGNKFLSINPDLKVPTTIDTSTPAMTAASKPPTDNSPIGMIQNTLADLPDASEKVSSDINNAVINKPADLLSNTKFMQQVGAGMNADPGDFGSNFATSVLQKLSLGLNGVTGLTGGLYKAPQLNPDKPDDLDKGITALTTGLGMAVGIGAFGKIAAAAPGAAGVIDALTSMTSKLPLVGKYIAPFIAPLLENASGFAAFSQLNPDLANNLQARTKTFLEAIGDAPIYTALGAVTNPAVSLPASFALGFGMAKLSGASNKAAAAAGATFAFLDAAGNASGERGNTPEQQQALNEKKMADEAYAVLSKYSGVKVSEKSTDTEIKTAYRKAIHVAHPDAGGTQESGVAVNNAYNLVTKGRQATGEKPTPEEQSIKTLRGEIQKTIEKSNPDVARTGLMENLQVDYPTADRLVRAAQTPNTPAELREASKSALATLYPEFVGDKGIPVAGVNSKQFGRLSTEEAEPLAKIAATRYQREVIEPEAKAGGAVVISADALKDHFGKDYNANNHPVYSQAANTLFEQAVRTSPADTVKFTVGGTGAGKSDFLVPHASTNFKGGVVYDSTGYKWEGGLKQQIDFAKAAGKKVKIYGIIPELERSKAYTFAREDSGEHPVSDASYVRTNAGAIETMISAIKDGEDVYVLDARGSHTKEDIKNSEFELNPLATLEKLEYTEEHVRQATEHVTKENYREVIAGRAEGTGKVSPENRTSKINTQKGAVSPGKIGEDVIKSVHYLKDIIDHHQEVDDIVGQISNSIYKEEGANKALKVQLTQLVNDARTKSTATEREHVYHYMEDNRIELTDNEKKNVLPLVQAMDTTLEKLRAKAREDGIYITGDILGEHTPRNAVEKGGVIDKAIEAYQAGKKIISNGGKLSTSVGSGSKHRVYHSLTDETGKRTVVAIKDGRVSSIVNGKSTDLGTTNQLIRPKVTEFFDDSVMKKLNTLAKDLGITHQRVATGKSTGLGNGTAGVSFGGADLIKTRLGPTSVLAHEIGHQIDKKYGLQDVMKEEKYDAKRKADVQKELRALADKRFEDRATTDHFKKYVRKESEKMAVMFEAYVANREVFKEVAPHLYDDFRDFLSSHEELKPFLDIKPSISLGSEKHGGDLVSGIAGKEFVDKSGNSHIVGQATTKEIEANTKTRYYKDPLANYALAIERTARAVRANELLNKIKQSPEFSEAIKNIDTDGDIPTDFKTTKLQQFRNYRMEPHLAEAFDDLAARTEGDSNIYDKVNNLLISALVINPIMHFPNVAIGWGAATAAAGVVPETNFMDTFKQVINKDTEYLNWVKKGAPFQYLRQTNAEFADAMLADVVKDIQKEPSHYEEISKALGYANPIEWAKGFEKLSGDATWVANDVMLFNALKTYQKANNSTFEKAIEEVSKRMADYRVPPRVLGSRALSVAMQNNAVFVFTRFHYSGVIKPWVSSIGDSFDPRNETNGGPSKQERLSGMRALAYFAMMYFIYQLADKGLEKLTGNPNTYISMAGPMRIPQNIIKSVEEGTPVPAIASTLSLTPAISLVGTIMTGYDFSNFFKPVYGPGGEGIGTAVGNQAALYQGVVGAFNGNASWTNYALSMGGVYSPKTTAQTSTLNGMLNVEKPQVEAQMKASIFKGDSATALSLAKGFNDRLKAAIKAADIANGNSGSDAQVNYFFQTFPNGIGAKGYAVRMPSATSMANYAAKQGVSSGNKVLPNTGIPSDSTNHDNPGSVARVVHGVTIYNRMSNENQVKKELEGGVVQPNTIVDHIDPLEGGGTNEVDNLQIISTEMNNVNYAVEEFIGREVGAGRMSAAQSQEIAVRYKAGLGEALTPALQNEYRTKYGSKPLTLAEVNDYAHTVLAK